MWVLQAQTFSSNDERSQATQTAKHHLTAGSHVVGRQAGQCALVVEEDKSISRSHAILTVSYDDGGYCVVKDNSRYGTLINKQELNGGQQEVHDGDFLQFGHKSIFRVCKWEYSIAALPGTAATEQHLSQLGFRQAQLTDAACIVAPNEVSFTPAMAQVCQLHKPVTTIAWLQAWLQRGCLKDAPPEITAYQPIVLPPVAPQLAAQQYSLPQQTNGKLFSNEHFLLSPAVVQEHPQLLQVLQSWGGSIVADALLGKATMVMPDGQKLQDVAVPAHAEELCVTSVGRLLGAVLANTVEGMVQQRISPDSAASQQPAQGAEPQSNKRKTPAGSSLDPSPMLKRRRATDVAAVPAPSPPPMQTIHASTSNTQPANLQATDSALDAPEQGAGLQVLQNPTAQAIDSQSSLPDNCTVTWAPLIAQARPPQTPILNHSGAVVNFKKFRKVPHPQHGTSVLGYSSKGYAESHIDSEAFLRQQASKQQQQNVAEELFSANVRVQKQPALPPAGATGRGRGRGRGR